MDLKDSLGELPSQPLPSAGFLSGIFVTTWAVAVLFFAGYLYRRIWYRKKRSTWTEFGDIFFGACVLFIYYALMVIDRWAHYESAVVSYNYIALEPIAEGARVVSTIFLLLGAWSVLWHERKDRYSPKAQAGWWLSANSAAFVVIMLSLYYVGLFLALTVVWLRFVTLDIIDKVAASRNHFKVAMSVGYFILSSVIFLGATHNFRKAREVDGPRASGRIRITLWFSTFFLAIRCLVEMGLNCASATRNYNPNTISLVFDIAYGTFTFLFFLFAAVLSRIVANPSNKAGHEANRIGANVRWCILNRLEERTENRTKSSPELRQLLNEVKDDIPRLIQEGDIVVGNKLTVDAVARMAREYIDNLLKEDLTLLAARQDSSQQPQFDESGSARDGIWGFLSISSLRSAQKKKGSRGSMVSNTSNGSAQDGGSRNPNQRSSSEGVYRPPQNSRYRQEQQPRYFSAGSAPQMPIHQEDVLTQFEDRPYRAPGGPTRTPSDATSSSQPRFVPGSVRSWSPALPRRQEYTESIRDQMSTRGHNEDMDDPQQPPAGLSYSQRISHGRGPFPPGYQQWYQPPAQPSQPEQYQMPEQQFELASVPHSPEGTQRTPPPTATVTPIYQPQPTPQSHSSRPGQVYTGVTIRPPASAQ